MGHSCHFFCSFRARGVQRTRTPSEISTGMLICFTSRADAASRSIRPSLLALLVTGDRSLLSAGEHDRQPQPRSPDS